MTKSKSQSSEYLSLVDRTAKEVLRVSKTIPKKRDWTCIAEGQVRERVFYSLQVGYEGYPDTCDSRPLPERRYRYYKEIHYTEQEQGRISPVLLNRGYSTEDSINTLLQNSMFGHRHNTRVRILTDILKQIQEE